MSNPRDARRTEPPEQPPAGQPWRTEGVPPQGREPEPPGWGRVITWLLLGWVVLFGLTTLQDVASSQVATISYTEFRQQVEEGNVEEVFSRGQSIEGRLAEPAELPEGASPAPAGDGGTYTQFVTERPTFAQDDLLAELEASDAVVRATPITQERGILPNLLISLLPLALLVGFYVWLFRRARKAGGMGAGMLGGLGGKKAKPVDPEKVRVNFDDVAGIDEVEAEVAEIVDFLKNPEKYTRLGAKVPRGVLLEGGPGTGKTLLARATAGEAEVPFFSASASEFIEMIVGVGAQRVRDLFAEARKVAPAIIFIDEIDTIGRSRSGARSMGGNDEREQTLNQILTEMDGFDGTEGVVVLAATNRADVLDDALTRPGRFDRKITVSPPDQAGREQILAVHTRGKPLAPDVDLGAVSRSTPGMTGADLANLANEAALLAAKRGQDQIFAKDFADALEKVQLGSERAVVMPEEERLRTAYHEAGHALLGMLRPGADPVRKISIIPRGRALGVTLSTPETDRYGYDVDYLRGRIIGALGGMAAEQEIFGVITTGAESDLQTVTAIARQMVGRWGMSEKIGPVQVYPSDGDARQNGASEALLEAVDAEVRALVDDCYAEARRLLRENRDKHEAIVAALMEHETLDEADAYAAAGIERRPADPHLVGAPAGSPGHRDA
ncbi:ATP-dependent zinc metalloprotease FtsH [Georgenia daeguensis]|uniref:ATP-dependent zinc metalloprotease FtsH n=1 Tax=Georgenia daeguensis TaxID=908355 RepID=UPI0031E5C38B